jgi:hypothetical protein
MEKVAPMFADARTHTTDPGAQFNAACVIAGLKNLANNPLAPYFSEKAKEIEPWQPAAQSNSTNSSAKPSNP